MSENILSILPHTIENEPLSKHTTFKLGGPARYFYQASDAQHLLLAIQAAEKAGLEYFILGWGSNLLVSDDGYKGLVIKNTSDKIEVKGDQIEAESGVNLSRLIGEATRAGLSGLEFAAGIPGTVGGAVFGNAGAYGKSFGDAVLKVKIYRQGKVEEIPASDLKFGYRQSGLKDSPGLVLSVTLSLIKDNPKNIQARILEIFKGRKDRVPFEPSAGCVFKNIDLRDQPVDRTRVIKELDISETEYDKATAHGKLPIGFVIDSLGLKGKVIGGCRISEKHSAFFVNVGDCRAEHVMMMISDVKMRVRNQLGLQLQEEIRYLGF